jgi:hypothetical protein
MVNRMEVFERRAANPRLSVKLSLATREGGLSSVEFCCGASLLCALATLTRISGIKRAKSTIRVAETVFLINFLSGLVGYCGAGEAALPADSQFVPAYPKLRRRRRDSRRGRASDAKSAAVCPRMTQETRDQNESWCMAR